MEALRRGAGPSTFEDYLLKRPIPAAAPLIKANYLAREKKSWDLRILIEGGSPEGLGIAREFLAETGGDTSLRSRIFKEVIEGLYRTPGQEGWDLLPDLYEGVLAQDRLWEIRRIPERKPHAAVVSYLVSLLDRAPTEEPDFMSRKVTLDFASVAAEALAKLDAADALGPLYDHWHLPGVRLGSVMLVARHPCPESAGRLVEMIRNRDYAAWRRIEIALAEVAGRDPQVLPDLSDDPDTEVRRKAAAVCGRLTGSAEARRWCIPSQAMRHS